MYSIGKKIRMKKIMDDITKKTLIIPMDHGMSFGPIKGLVRVKSTVKKIIKAKPNAIIVHKGLVKSVYSDLRTDIGLITHISASTSLLNNSNFKVIISSVQEAVRLGSDGVSIHINLGNNYEKEMLHNFGKIADDADKWGMPLLAMVYIRGNNVNEKYAIKHTKHAARLAAEIGADIVKVAYTGNPNSFYEVTSGCDIPVVVAGGSKINSNKIFLGKIKGAMEAGAAGVSIGRNIFQHANPDAIIGAISDIIHNKITTDEAISRYKIT